MYTEGPAQTLCHIVRAPIHRSLQLPLFFPKWLVLIALIRVLIRALKRPSYVPLNAHLHRSLQLPVFSPQVVVLIALIRVLKRARIRALKRVLKRALIRALKRALKAVAATTAF